MADDRPGQWPRRVQITDLAHLDDDTRRRVMALVHRLQASVDSWGDRVVALTREHVPGYDVVPDDELRDSARAILEGLISELASLRLPDDAARGRLEGLALRRVAQGVSMDALSLSYRLGSREMLTLMDGIARDVGLPSDLLVAMHDSSWEFANEAATIFARVQRDLTVERARFDAERRSAFARGVLGGGLTADQVHRDAALFGLDARRRYVAVAARGAQHSTEAVRRVVAQGVRVSSDRLLFAELGPTIGCIAPRVPEGVRDHLVAAGPPLLLEELDSGFEEAVLALDTAERFGLTGVVELRTLGPKPLVLSAGRVAAGLEARHLARLEADGRSAGEVEETTRVFLECDQQVREAASRLTVHPNTVRYRVNRFRELTGLDLRRTDDLVTAWWLLNWRRGVDRPPSEAS